MFLSRAINLLETWDGQVKLIQEEQYGQLVPQSTSLNSRVNFREMAFSSTTMHPLGNGL